MSSSNEAAEAAKSAGNAAMKESKYDDALAEYTKAIELDPDHSPFYSNRSMCYMKMKDPTKALADAEEAVRLKRDGAKGYIRKGDALYALRNYTGAGEAYGEAVSHDPSNAKAKSRREAAHRMASASQQSAYNSANGGSQSETAISALLHLGILILSVGYLVPTAFSHLMYYNALKLTMMSRVMQVFRERGRPQLNLNYWKGLLTHPSVHRIFPCLVFAFAPRPLFLALVPNAIWCATSLSGYISTSVPSAVGVLAPLISRVMGNQVVLQQTSGRVDVMLGFVLILAIFTPYRSILSTLMYWQFLQLQYMMPYQILNPNYIKITFNEITAYLDSKILAPDSSFPSIVATGYSKFKGVLAGMTDPQQAAQRPSMMSMCNIM